MSLGIAASLLFLSLSFSGCLQIVNPASGALDKEATITADEMMEHAFYQGINLVQIAFLHSTRFTSQHPSTRAAALLLVSLPWATRSR
jgi:hypothetical protein